MTKPVRAADITLPIDAPLEDVWKALTDGRELTRWFPLQADVEPRVGGRVAWRWLNQFAMLSHIDAWNPPLRLRLVQKREVPHGADGAALDSEPAAEVAIEFTLETREGRTWLHLVHSGFGDGTAWDDELEGVTNGWNYELRSLIHYLAHHRGHDRHYGWAMTTTPRPAADAWKILLADGLILPEAERQEDASFRLTAPGDVTLSGMSRLHIPGREWFGTVSELDNGLVRASTWRGGGTTGVNLWFATWNPAHAATVAKLGQSAQEFLYRRFGTG